MQKNNYLLPFILICSLFFLWAFLHNMNPILIPHLKKACQLSDTQSSFIDSAVYLGYFLAAIPAGLFIHRWGYKKGIIFGLSLFAVGSLLFIPAADVRQYWFFLFALFVAACGATFLETIANPYATVLGDPSTAEQRLNFAQSFNGVGAFVAPLIGSRFIFSGVEHTKEELQGMSPEQLNAYLNAEASTVKIPYLVIGCVIIIVILLFAVTKLPEVKEDDSAAHGTKFSLNVFKFSHVRWAVFAEFCYVGSQVGVGSFFVRFSKYLMDLPEKDAGYWWGSIAMVGFMVGRFAGTFFMRFIKPAKLLTLYAVISILLIVFALVNHNQYSVYAVMATPFFMSIMFPTIFALGIKGLGEETKIASSFLVMSIIGGGVIAPIMGLISDATGSIQSAYIVPVFCFAVILYFGWRGHKIKAMETV
ncbi:MAG TPA: L-fucose:H+ symporter permease [Panacibacter sp.]|nr:L-fucose:H+ symporter permease [Panacibacter sp.]HNP45893.1 L-fucose:H+ symporter permease [Panacibacter sp.]